MRTTNAHTTPERFLLSIVLIVSFSIGGTTLGADAKKERFSLPATDAAARRSINPVSLSLPAVGGTWTSRGPGPILNGQVEGIANRPVVGAINALVAHPTSADTLWIGSVNGGIWKTTNATNASPTWTAQTDSASSLSIGDLQRDPTDVTHNTLIAATGNYSSYGISGPEGTLLRTTNGGTAWSVLTPTALAGMRISGVAARGATIVVSAYNCGPVFRSTNTGATFSLVGGLPHGGAWDLAGDPNNNAVLYIAITECVGGAGTLNGVYKSTDTGATWTRVSNATMNTQLNGAGNAEISVGTLGQIYVAIVGGSNQLSGIFRSGNGGTTWTQLDTPTTIEAGTPYGIHPGSQGYIHLSLAADASNANLVYVGGDRQPHPPWPNSLGSNDYTGRLFRVNAAAPGGSQATSLTHCQSAIAACNGSVSTNSNSAPHADSRAMAVDANGNLLEVDDGGIYRRTSPGGTGDWSSVNGNLQITEVHNVVYDRISNMIMGGNQDNGTAEQTAVGGMTWTAVLGGDGGDVAADDTTSPTHSVRYGSYQYLDGFFRRTMNSSGVATVWRFPGRTVIGGGPLFEGQFTTPVELNRVDPRRILFAGDNDLYESLDRGDTITALNLNKNVRAAVYGGRAGGVDNLDLIYAISQLGPSNTFQPTVYLRTSGGGAPVPTAAQPTTSFLRDIAVDPTDWQKAYVVTQAGTVFSTSNGGASWTDITGNLGSGSTDLWTILHISGSPAAIVVGGANGVFRMATNNPGVWNQLGTGLSNALVYDLDYDPVADTLVAGTIGRGAWTLAPVSVSGVLPSLSINDVAVTEGNSGSTNATFTVSLSASTGYAVGVNYATANGSATGQSTGASNPNVISIPDNGTASPYPSTIAVSGVTDPIKKVTVTLHDFNHTYVGDIDVLLVGPGGQSVILMSDVADGYNASGLDLTFDDAAASQLPNFAFGSGTYRPTDYESGESFASPAPGAPYGSTLTAFSGASANGTWSLYVFDDAAADQGGIYSGWTLTLTSGDYSPTSGLLIFPPGTTSRTVSVTVHGDTASEVNETFSINLSSPSNATISDSQGQGTITNDDAFSPPTNVVATATASTNVNITWTAAAGGPTYRVYRSSGSAYTLIGSTAGTILSDPDVSANTAYIYKVRSFAGVESTDSNIDLATTVIFTDQTLVAGSTLPRAVHYNELLMAVNAVRTLASQSGIAFTAPPPAVGVAVLGTHITELRNGLNPARSALGLPAQGYTDAVITAGSTLVKAAHINDLRNGVR